MKKLVTIILSLVLALGCCAAFAEDDGYFVAYLAKDTYSSFHNILNHTAEPLLDQMVADGVIAKWQLFDGTGDAAVQCDLLETAINMGADLVVLLPTEAEACAPIITRCNEVGIPTVVVNATTTNIDEATAYVGSDDYSAGEMMGKWVEQCVPEGGKWCMVTGLTGNSAATGRADGAKNILCNNDKFELMDVQDGQWDPSKGVQFAEDWLQLYGDDLVAIICGDDDTSAAIQVAANAAGHKDLVCVGVNGGATACALIAAGEMQGTVYQNGVAQMTKAMEIVRQIAAGEDYPAGMNWVDFEYITPENVAEFVG